MTHRSGLRFAMVTTFYPPYNFGGDGMYVRRLAHCLAKRGHTVDIIHDVDAYVIGGGKETKALPEPAGVRTHPLRSMFPRLSTLATQQSGQPLVHGRAIQQILATNFDVIHFHNVSLVGGPKVLSYGSGIKFYTAHEHWLVCPTHILWRYNREPCDRRECLRCVIAARRPPQLWRRGAFLDNQMRHVDELLALSEFSAQKHKEFGLSRAMTVFPSFIPDDEAADEAPEKSPEVTQHPYFLFVGRLEPIKGLPDVIARFDERMPAELWIVGAGNQEAELRELSRGKANVKFLGRRSPAELRLLYRNAVALIASSKCFEVFPLVMLEAFREGTPVVARELGPYPEIIEQAQAGLLFSNEQNLDQALRRLVSDAGLRKRLGENASRAFRENWSEQVVLDRYMDLIRHHAKRRGMSDTLARMGGNL